MIHSFYFRFLKMTHCQWLSVILSRIAYFAFLVKFRLERLGCKPHIVKGDPKEAREKLSAIHPDPMGRAQCNPAAFDKTVDLSIIVPIYNYASLIRENIDSILNQNTQYQFELILVDDGSTDGALEIARSYASDPRVKVICQKNQGIAGARNTGLNHAVGRYFMFVDCDDLVTDDIVQTLLSQAYAGNCDIVMCAHERMIERNGQIVSVIANVYSDKNLGGYCDDAEILNYAGLPWCKVYKRELWDNVRFLPGYWYEDVIIQALLFTQCKNFSYVPKICYRYRWYEKNFSHTQGKSSNPKCLDRYWMLLPILEQARNLGITDGDRFYTMLLQHLCLYYYRTISKLDADIIEAAFILAQELFAQYRLPRQVKLPYMLRMVEEALSKGDIELWKAAAHYS